MTTRRSTALSLPWPRRSSRSCTKLTRRRTFAASTLVGWWRMVCDMCSAITVAASAMRGSRSLGSGWLKARRDSRTPTTPPTCCLWKATWVNGTCALAGARLMRLLKPVLCQPPLHQGCTACQLQHLLVASVRSMMMLHPTSRLYSSRGWCARFPTFGRGTFTTPPLVPGGKAMQSHYVSDKVIGSHPRFR